nr:MAG TPA: hypothetical protein [Caudoviricetes sp.]
MLIYNLWKLTFGLAGILFAILIIYVVGLLYLT